MKRGTRRMVMLAGALVLVFAAAPSAQEFGVKGGLTRSEFFASGDGWEAGTGFQAGGFYERPLTGGFTLRPELFITRRATSSEAGSGDERITSALRVDYLELPVLAAHGFGRTGRLRPDLFAGPFAALRLGARMRTEAGGHVLTEDFSDVVSRTDYGFVIGAGLKFRNGGRAWLGEVRYTRGLRRADDDAFAEPARNRTLSLLAGVAF